MSTKENSKGKVDLLKRHQLSTIQCTLAPYYLEKKTPHYIIELSVREVKIIKDNIIHIGDLYFSNDKNANTILSFKKCGIWM